MPQISLWRYAGYLRKTLARAARRAGNPVAIRGVVAGARISYKAVTRFARCLRASVESGTYDVRSARKVPASSNGRR